MSNKFTEGLLFGGGFAISFVIIWYLAAYFISPVTIVAKIEPVANEHLSEDFHIQDEEVLVEPEDTQSQAPKLPILEVFGDAGPPFHELPLEDQIKQSSVIVLVSYEAAADGSMKAVIKEFLKKDPGITFFYNTGDEYPAANFSPQKNISYGDGAVLFFTGSPAAMKLSISYSGNRIQGLDNLAYELFREDYEEADVYSSE